MINHINKKNKPFIVDISKKKQTLRTAKAQGIIKFSKMSFKNHFESMLRNPQRGIRVPFGPGCRDLNFKLKVFEHNSFRSCGRLLQSVVSWPPMTVCPRFCDRLVAD